MTQQNFHYQNPYKMSNLTYLFGILNASLQPCVV